MARSCRGQDRRDNVSHVELPRVSDPADLYRCLRWRYISQQAYDRTTPRR